MKKLLTALAIAGIMLAPAASYADTLTPQQHATIQQILSALVQELTLLQQEVQQLEDQQAALSSQIQNTQTQQQAPEQSSNTSNPTPPVEDNTPASTPALAVTVQSTSAKSVRGSDPTDIAGDYTIVLGVTAGPADAYVPQDGIDASPVGSGSYDGTQSLTVASSASQQDGYWLIPAGTTATFTVENLLTLPSGESGTYELDATAIRYSPAASADGQQTLTFLAQTNPMLLATK